LNKYKEICDCFIGYINLGDDQMKTIYTNPLAIIK